MTTPFIIYALPRSRTFWLSHFLAYGDWKCGHDELRHLRGLDDLKSLLEMPYFGSVETAAAPYWRLIHQMRPDLKTVVIRRPVEEVVQSLLATGVNFDEAKLRTGLKKLDAKLDQIECRVPNVLSVNFHDLNEKNCGRIFAHCLGQKMPQDWDSLLKDLRLTVDLEWIVRYYNANKPQIERLGRLAKQRMLTKIHAHRPVNVQGMTFQQESLDEFIPDAQNLFSQHSVEVGERPDSWETKNIELMYAIEAMGALYITTARSNGRMFGYLMSIVSPALDSRTGKDATHTLFYVSPDTPGIGLKLQRASIEFLRGLGVDQVAFRAGLRGSGEKISALYRRLGAEDVGKMYLLDLKESA